MRCQCDRCGKDLSVNTSMKAHWNSKTCIKIHKEKKKGNRADQEKTSLEERKANLNQEKTDELQGYWFFLDDQGTYHPYSHRDAKHLEYEWSKLAISTILRRYQWNRLKIAGFLHGTYEIDLITMTQTTVETKRVRSIRRELKPMYKSPDILNVDELKEKFSHIPIPDVWDSVPFQSHNNVETNGKEYARIRPAKDSAEHKSVMKHFNTKALGDWKLIDLERIQNPEKTVTFETAFQCKKLILGEELQRKTVFHGCYSEVTSDIIIRDSFNGRFNATSKFGKGTYFSPYPDVCIAGSYCAMPTKNTLQMFMCEIMDTGNVAIGDSTMLVEPLIGTTSRRADMLVNDLKDPTIICVPSDANILVKYLITLEF